MTGIGVSIEARAAGGETPIEPALYAFLIWVFIFLGCSVYGVYQALPSQRENRLLRQIGFYTASAFLANTTYSLVAQIWGNDWVLAGIFVWTLTSLLKVFFQFPKFGRRITNSEKYFVVAPISVFTGWVSLAIIVNTASALKTSGFSNFGLSEGTWAILLLLIAGIIGSYLTLASQGNAAYALTVIWGFIGIVVANLTRNQNIQVAFTAGVMAAFIAVILLLSREEKYII